MTRTHCSSAPANHVDSTLDGPRTPVVQIPLTREGVVMTWIPLVNVRPDPGKLPGGNVIQQLLDGLSGWALFGSLAALLISAIAAPALINFFNQLGRQV
jgi:hypothetical protein